MANAYEDLLNPAAAANSYEDLVQEQTGEDYQPYTPEMKRDTAMQMKGVAGAGIVGLAAAAGGGPLAGYGMAAELAGSTGGTMVGEYMRQKLFGEPTDIKEIGKAGAINVAGGVIGRLAAEAYGALGGIAPQYTRYVTRQGPIKGYKLTMMEPAAEAELNLGRQIGRSIPTDVTEPRIKFATILQQHKASGGKVSLDPVIKALEDSKIQNPKFPESVKFNKDINQRIKSLATKQKYGGMNAVELDNFINKELDPKAFTKAGDLASQKLSQPYADARDAAREALLNSLPPEARVLGAQVHEELNWRELSKKYFGKQVSGRSIVSTIKGMEAPGSEEVKQTLAFVSEQSGIDFNKMAMELATRRAFTSDDRVKLSILNRIMAGIGGAAVLHGDIGAGAAMLSVNPTMARIIAKVITPLHGIAGPGGVSLYEYLKQDYGVRGQPQPTPQTERGIYKQTRVNPQQAVSAFEDAMSRKKLVRESP